jgi:asparagine synthase (glutamine-hydrolysing)
MFAFGLYDSEHRQLFLARDRAGEKPLYYWHTNGRIHFASELKALMANPALPRHINFKALDYYLAYGYVPGDMCILKEVKKLRAGHAMKYDLESGEIHSWQYWSLPKQNMKMRSDDDPEELLYDLEGLLKDSVRRQLIADVPVVIMLSGGLDSSLVTAIAAETSPHQVRTFNVSFRGHETFDESKYAQLIAKHFGSRHEELFCDPVSFNILPDISRQFDEPIADHAIVPTYLLSHQISRHAKVALSGDGGDELFGGYHHYNWILRQAALRNRIPGFIRGAISHMGSRVFPLGMRGRNHIIGLDGDNKHSISHINLYFDHFSRSQLYTSDARSLVGDTKTESYRGSMCHEPDSLLRQSMEADFHTTLTDGYLVKVDRASMIASLEVRVPFLDYRLIEFAYGRVPDDLKVTKDNRKILLRKMAERLLPKNYDVTRKQGFTMPLNAWFKGDWGTYMRSVLLDSENQLFDTQFIKNLLSLQVKGYSNSNRIFALTVFELWRREYNAGIG